MLRQLLANKPFNVGVNDVGDNLLPRLQVTTKLKLLLTTWKILTSFSSIIQNVHFK